MPAKPNARNWNDVQTAIATVAIVTTLGLWNLFATPSKKEATSTSQPVVPPPTEPPVQSPAQSAATPTAMPPVKIMFTPGVVPTTIVQQANQQVPAKKKKKNADNGGSGGGGTVTQTKTS